MNRHALRVTGATIAIVLLLNLALAVVIVAANVAALPLGTAGANGATILSLLAILAGAALGVLLFAVLLAIGLDDCWQGRPLSSLYPPLLAFAGILVLILVFSAVNAVDLIAHDLRLGWHITDDPDLRVLINVLLLSLFGALGWAIVVILSGREWATRELVLLLAALTGVTAFAAVLPFSLAR